MASSTPSGSDTTVVVPRVERENASITTDWWHMITHAYEVPCMGKALGYGGVGGVATGIVNRFVRGRSAFDGWVLGFMVSSSAVFFTCYSAYERELKMTKQLMMAQSRPVSAEDMMTAEKVHIAKLTNAPTTPTGSDSTTKN